MNVLLSSNLLLPGQTLYPQLNLCDANGQPLTGEFIGIQVNKPSGEPYFVDQPQTDENGYAYSFFQLSPQAPMGTWTIWAASHGVTSSATFFVSSPTFPILEVNFSIPSSNPYSARFLTQLFPVSPTVPVFTISSTVPSVEGVITIYGIPPGTYDVKVKERQCLSFKVRSVIFSAGNVSLELGPLSLGDINNDDVVNIYDFSILAGSYSKSQGQPGFDARADLNHDNLINIYDFSILAGNYGKRGG
ncbi:MAG: dockerin type I domain-containing protein [Coprothermobacterota bacterium]|nr:dockerin type I domain-containing protein [Coprothermobacterota bacterium]